MSQAEAGLPRTHSLKARVMGWTLAILVAIAVPAGAAFLWLVDTTVLKLGTLVAEKQILFDRYRGLEALMREVSLAETVARAPAIVDWAQDEADPEKAGRGLDELEHYRLSFRDRSYFTVIAGSGNYYFNDKDNSYEHDRKRYTLSSDNPRDGWYYKTAALGSGCHLNVDHDDHLRVTKVWINCIIRKDARVLGIIGTGLDLTQFIREVVDIPQNGVQSMFVDRSGAVQAHRDASLVDFHSLTKDIAAKKTIYQLVDNNADRVLLGEMFARIGTGDTLVQSRFMHVEGKRVLVGIGYLDRLGWFNVTVMDIDRIIDRRLFLPLALLFGAVLLAAAALMTVLFKRAVLDRLARVEQAAQHLRANEFRAVPIDPGRDEIGRLSQAFGAMEHSIEANTARLEEAVRERTEQLERLAHADPLTGVFNRRGFERAFAASRARARRAGLLLVDLDNLKPINDRHGHQGGDAVLTELARRMTALLCDGDICARWGGDEFILLLDDIGPDELSALAARIVAAAAQSPVDLDNGACVPIGISVGATLLEPRDTLADAARRADEALYAAKRAGRNGFAVSPPEGAPMLRRIRA
jgi:diguanylate cyclase (GGDEF)-like protein